MKRKIILQLAIGITGTALVFFLWKLLSPALAQCVSPQLQWHINILAIWSMALPPLLIMLFSRDSFSDCGFSAKQLPRQILTGIGIGFAMAGVLTLLPMLLLGKENLYGGPGYQTAADAVKGFIYFVFVVGLSEEFIFRGFLYSKLDNYCATDTTPIVLSSVIFGIYHFSGFNFVQVLIAGLIGAFFCLCKKNIPGCTVLSLAIAHGIHDWMIRLLATLL